MKKILTAVAIFLLCTGTTVAAQTSYGHTMTSSSQVQVQSQSVGVSTSSTSNIVVIPYISEYTLQMYEAARLKEVTDTSHLRESLRLALQDEFDKSGLAWPDNVMTFYLDCATAKHQEMASRMTARDYYHMYNTPTSKQRKQVDTNMLKCSQQALGVKQ